METTRYRLHSPKLNRAVRIAHLSDLHTRRFGPDNTRLLAAIRSENPNFIVITGDLVDRRKADLDYVTGLCRSLTAIARVFYVVGNHEISAGRAIEIKKAARQGGAWICGESTYTVESDSFLVCFFGMECDAQLKQTLGSSLAFYENFPGYRICLTHRPELFDAYAEYSMDLFLCGHAHGGQIRLPFVGGLFAPGQGLFPKYTQGLYQKNNAHMLVSRGFGNSGKFPFRVFNHPELVVLDILPPA